MRAPELHGRSLHLQPRNGELDPTAIERRVQGVLREENGGLCGRSGEVQLPYIARSTSPSACVPKLISCRLGQSVPPQTFWELRSHVLIRFLHPHGSDSVSSRSHGIAMVLTGSAVRNALAAICHVGKVNTRFVW